MPDRLQADPRDPRAPARGDEEPVAAQLPAVGELEHVVGAVAARRGDVRAEDDVDAVAAQDVGERVAERRRLAGEDARAALDERDLAAEAADGLGELDADGAAAEHEQPARDAPHRGRLAVGPQAVEVAQSGDRRDEGVGAVREHHLRGRVARAADLHRAGAGEPAGPAQERDALLGQPALLPRVRVVGDHEVAVRERGVDVDLGGRRRLPRRVHGLARPQQRLRRDARPVRALAPDELPLDDGDAEPALGERSGAVLPGRPAAQDDDVVVAHDATASRAAEAKNAP